MRDAARRQFMVLCGASLPLALAPSWAPAAQADKSAPAFDASLKGLVDTQGKAFDETRYRGLHRIVVFGFTSCADVCPLTLMIVRDTLKKLGPGSSKVVPFFISVDPERDSPARLAAYVNAFDPRIQALTGSNEALQRVAKGHGIFFEKRWVNPSTGAYVYDHTASILVIDSRYRLVQSVSTSGTPDQIVANLVKAVSGIAPQ